MRPAVAASVLALVGCIGSNPEWNRPDGSVVTVGDASTGGGSNADSRGAGTTVLTSAPSSDPSDDGPHESVEGATESGSTGGGTTGAPPSAEAGDDTIATSPPSDDGADGVSADDGRRPSETSGDDPPPPACAPDEQLCAGVCTEIDHDKHACGPECIDCTELYGNTAQCHDGECEPHDGHGDGDEGKGGGEGKGG